MLWLVPLIALLVAGLVAGFAAGLFGIGGGFVVVPALLAVLPLLGGDTVQYAHVAIGTSAATIIVTSIRSLRAHALRNAVEFEVLRTWVPWLIIGDALGVVLAGHVDGTVLTLVFGIGVALMSLKFLVPGLADHKISDEMPGMGPRVAIAGGLGAFSSLLGIGGGTIAIMVMTLCGRSIHRAIATASGIGALIAIPSAIGFAIIGYHQTGLPWDSIGYVNVPAAIAITSMSILFAMIRVLPEEAQDDLQSRGYSRRDMARLATVFSVGAMAASVVRPAWASGGVLYPAPTARTRIGANECWTGPLMPGQIAAQKMVEHGNHYSPKDERGDFIKAVMAVEGVPYDHVAPWPGSSDPLSRAVVSYCSPTRGLVTADPTFELAGRTAEWLGAPVTRVPLTKDFRHDVKAMLAADPNAGLYYICTPNNPTGTITPLEDIEWLIAHKPEGAMVLVDEAYTHFAGVPVASSFAVKYKDVIVMRTFSKIFGMAGLPMGFIMTQPANIAKMMRYDGGMQSGALPPPR